MPFLFSLTLLIWVLCFSRYYKRQNGPVPVLGGPISRAKTMWLGLTTYCYFVLPPLLYFATRLPPAVRHLTLVFMSLLLLRALVQSILMFIIHRWSPPFGMSLNIMYTSILVWQSQRYFLLLRESGFLQIIPGLWVGLMLTDTIFAWKFFKIVGSGTQGKDAIWYASEAPEFDAINRLTWIANVFFYAYLAGIIGLIWFDAASAASNHIK